MSLRLAMVIDGDASGAQKAAVDAQRAIGDVGQSASAAAGKLNGLANANDNAQAHAGLANRQFGLLNGIVRSAVDTITLGVPPTAELALIMERLTLSAGEEGAAAVFTRLKGTIAGVVTPTNLLIGAILGVVGGGYLLYQSIKQTELQFGALADRSAVAISQLHAFQSAAAFKGIDQGDFLKSMQGFADLTSQAKDGLGSLAQLFRANGVAAGTLSQNLEHVADLVRNAGSEAERYRIVQAAGLPATRQWVEFLKQGSDGIRDAADSATKFGGAADEKMIKKAGETQERWDTFWHTFGDDAKSAFVAVLAGIDTLNKKAIEAGADLHTQMLGIRIDASMNALDAQSSNADRSLRAGLDRRAAQLRGGGVTTVDPAVLQRQLALESARIGVLGQLATIEQTVRNSEIQIQQARLAGVNITAQDEARIKAWTEAQALGTNAIHQQADAQQIEAATVGMSTGAAAAYRAEQERLADFRLRGIALTKQQTDALHAEAQALGEATQAAAVRRLQSDVNFETQQIGRTADEQQVAQRLRAIYGDDYVNQMNGAIAAQIRFNQQLQATHDIGQQAFKGILTDLSHGAKLSDALRSAGTRMLDSFISRLGDMAFNGLWQRAFGGILGGSGTASNATPLLFDLGHVLGFDTGGYTGDAPASAIAGVVHGREYVFDAESTRRIGVPALEALRTGVRGYERGGYVAPPLFDSLMPSGGSSIRLDTARARSGPAGSAGQVNYWNVITPDARAFAEDRATVMRGLGRMMQRAARYA